MSRLRVGVNLLWLVPGEVGGSEEYTVRLLAALRDLDPDDIDVTLFVSRSFLDTYADLAARFTTVVCPISGRSRAIRIAAESSWLLVEARRRRVRLLHHGGGTIPPLRATPAIVTIHDLQPLLLPENFSRGKTAYLRWRLRPSVRKSRAVVTLTAYTASTITDTFGVPVELVPPGYTAALDAQPTRDPRSAFELTGPFFLYPAITYPHKNHATLVRAFAGVVATHPDALLVLTHRAAQMEDELRALIAQLGLTKNVRRLGHVDRGDLNWLYANAVALTFPSRFEGFGMPVLEAMGHRCAVIAARSAALPSVVGDAGVLVDPDDERAWTAAMVDLLDHDAHRAELAGAGAARVEREYQWQASAERLHRLYVRLGTTSS
ncbi:MAG TPA: glycosyltransferase family 1 protein [Acidimicrobiales bacterium]|nr:glycosyltransferase family 1 protein [Acidimicrobiales bacterium]